MKLTSYFLILILILSTPTFVQANEKPPQGIISKATAQKIASGAQEGKIQASELEQENQKWLYSIEIHSKDHQIHEINVDALSGQVLSNDIETPAMEQQEKRSDHR